VEKRPVDRLYWAGAFVVWLGSFIVYWLTVQRSIPFWDCGEFIAASAILGVPHPPGTPVFILIGRIFSILPIADDISFRINMISIISSAFTAMLAYMVTVRLIRYFFSNPDDLSSRLITLAGAVAGGFFVAFGATNWNNSVEAEVYGIAMALSMLILLLALKYYEERGSGNAKIYGARDVSGDARRGHSHDCFSGRADQRAGVHAQQQCHSPRLAGGLLLYHSRTASHRALLKYPVGG
jgi:hypothetical protein